jgi:Uncharacterized protein conserved in bacteria (DUF2334)
MTNWLDPVRRQLDDLPYPAIFFFRDDDAGWDDHRLYELLDIFAQQNLPIDLAAIPTAVTPSLARELSNRMTAMADKLHVHQHGYAHANHEATGRKCEFGPSRSKTLQKNDISDGKRRLQDLLGPTVDPIFTPPWNRCTPETGECLVELGFHALSRESGAVPLSTPGLAELPIDQDWFAHRKGVRLGRDHWAQSLTSKLESRNPIGIMFHHAVMDASEMQAAAELLAALGTHPRAQCRTMHSLLEGSVG